MKIAHRSNKKKLEKERICHGFREDASTMKPHSP
jgi:hypothetical protein